MAYFNHFLLSTGVLEQWTEIGNATLTQGVHIGNGPDAAEGVAEHFGAIARRDGETLPGSGSEQGANEIARALAVRG